MLALEAEKVFEVVGNGCILLDDPEKYFDVNEGRLLVPWGGDKTLLIDRYDCRAHLTDLNDYEGSFSLDPDEYLSEDELTIEKMCEFERYLELRVDVDEMVTQTEEEKKREAEKSRSQYGAVDFSYDENNGEATRTGKDDTSETAVECAPASPEDPYVCPSELQIPEGMDLPETDKQAQIIERTAVFVARQGNQMEIVLKAKQTNNPLFSFLNYDHKLNPFYKEMVKLIRSGRYIPKARPVKIESNAELKYEANKSIHEDVYELKLPKVDISNTAYASLINKFKKVNETARAAANAATQRQNSPVLSKEAENEACPTSEENQSNASPPRTVDSPKTETLDAPTSSSEATEVTICKPAVMNSTITSETQSNTAVTTPAAAPLLTEEYEQCYQEYYKHYYAHYYTQFSEQQAKALNQPCIAFSEEQRSAIVQQAAKAAAIAASAAVNAMYQAGIKQKSQNEMTPSLPSMTASERGIIDKMAEYVMRNGPEFEELVTRQKGNDPRFGFLKPNHPLHGYYQSRKQSLNSEKPPTTQNTGDPKQSALKEKEVAKMECSDDSRDKGNDSRRPSPEKYFPKERQSSISFRLSRPNSSGQIRSTASDRGVPSSNTTLGDHLTQPADVHTNSSYPVLPNQDVGSRSPKSPANSLASVEEAVNNRSHSPVKFGIPGIPSASDTSSAESSPRSRHRSATPNQTRSPSPQPPASVCSHTKNDRLGSPASSGRSCSPQHSTTDGGISANNKARFTQVHKSPSQPDHPLTDPPANTSSARKRSPHSKAWGSSAIEEMLDLVDSPVSKERSPDPSSLHHAAQKALDERIREERRKRAAQLVARLKSTSSAPSHKASEPATLVPSQSKTTVPPPPPPDSVPAAVAHAVVASLKRRQEETRATLEAQAKARKRARSPPAAYALPKERSHKSSKHSRRSRHSSSPESFPSVRSSSTERSHSKHKKHRKSKN